MRTDKMVSVVVPNYNGKAFIEPCLRSLAADAPEAEILVVDNASADGSREQVEQRFPEVRLIALERNYGFARAVNEGIRASTRPYVILLNNDTEVLPGFTAELVKALEGDRRAFSASAKLLSLKEPGKLTMQEIFTALWAGLLREEKIVRRHTMKRRVRFLRPVRARRSTGERCLRRSGILMKRILPIWKTSTWDGEAGLPGTGICTHLRPKFFMWAADPAVRGTMSLRFV